MHVVLKATSEQGIRLNIRKATLRDWRAQFAANIRELGVAANATERAVRGESRAPRSDGYFRSSHVSGWRAEALYGSICGSRAFILSSTSHVCSIRNV